MKKVLSILIVLCFWLASNSQTKYSLPYDTVIVTKPNGTGYLKASKGNFADTLFSVKMKFTDGNQSNGYVLTSDANGNAHWQVSAGGGGNSNSNVGAGYRWAIPFTNNIKTFLQGYGLLFDSATNTLSARVDTFQIATRVRVQKSIDSLGALIQAHIAVDSLAQAKYYLGTIYNQSTFASLSAFTQNGGTWGTSGGHITGSGGTNDYTKYLALNYYSTVEQWQLKANIKITQTGVNGVAIGMAGTYAGIFAWFDVNTGTLKLQSDVSTTLATSTILAFSLNDSIEITLTRNISSLVATVKNYTTKSLPVFAAYRYELAPTALIPIVTQAYPSIFTRGGTFEVNSFSYNSPSVVRSDVLFFGDSKTVGIGTTSFTLRYISQLQASAEIVSIAGSGSLSVDWVGEIPEAILLKPVKAVITNPSNDLRLGVAPSITKTNVTKIYDSLRAHGVDVYFMKAFYESAQDNSGWNTMIDTSFPANKIIAMPFSVLNTAGAINVDGIHPTAYGDSLIYYQIMLDGKLNITKGRPPFPNQFIQSVTADNLLIQNYPNTAFTGLQLGGSSVSFPMFKINSSSVELKTADDVSFNYDFKARDLIASRDVTPARDAVIGRDASITGGLRLFGTVTGASGSGLSLEYNAASYISSYNFGGAAYTPINIRGSTVSILNNESPSITTTTSLKVGIATVTSPTAYLHLQPSLGAGASLRMPTGTAPVSPNEGDMWQISNRLHFYTNSTDNTVAWLSDGISGLTTGRVPVASSSTALTDYTGLRWDATNNELLISNTASLHGLKVSGVNATILIKDTSASNTPRLFFQNSSGNQAEIFVPNFDMYFKTAGNNPVMKLYQSGNNVLLADDVGSASPSASAKLDIQSTTQGFLPPRMTATQASAISSPAEGLIVYVTNTNGTFLVKGWYGWNGAIWQQF